MQTRPVSDESLRWIEPNWSAPQWIRALTTERVYANASDPFSGVNLAQHVGDATMGVESNRRLLKQRLNLSASPFWLEQVHGTEIMNLDQPNPLKQADGSFTCRSGVVSVILTADCAPIFLTDRQGTFVALLHGGWRGIAAGIIEKALALMPSDNQEIIASVGPTIGPDYFQIGREVKDKLLVSHKDEIFFLADGDKFFADLPSLIVKRLERAGVYAVSSSDHCTYSDERRWYSYRRQGQCGRMASLIWIDRWIQ